MVIVVGFILDTAADIIRQSYYKTKPILAQDSLARAVYHTPSESVTARAYLRSSLSRSLLSTTMSPRNGDISSAFHRERVRKRSAKRAVGSGGSAEAGKYVISATEESLRGAGFGFDR